MADNVVLSVLENGQTARKLYTDCIGFTYSKEYYTPYTFLKGSFVVPEIPAEITDVEFSVNGVLIHKGIIDYCKAEKNHMGNILTVNSRSYTSMLGQNQLVPGLMTQISLNKLLDENLSLPNIYHEDCPAVSNYIYVKENASLWEAVTNLCLKQNGRYPYIAHVNRIMFSLPASPETVILAEGDGRVISHGRTADYSKAVSDIHMRDTEGTYNTFNYSDEELHRLGIVRHKHISFDRQWLDEPIKALRYRVNFSARGMGSRYAFYKGYGGEDLNDLMAFGNEAPRRISRIDIKGTKAGIVTRLACYKDKYFS